MITRAWFRVSGLLLCWKIPYCPNLRRGSCILNASCYWERCFTRASMKVLRILNFSMQCAHLFASGSITNYTSSCSRLVFVFVDIVTKLISLLHWLCLFTMSICVCLKVGSYGQSIDPCFTVGYMSVDCNISSKVARVFHQAIKIYPLWTKLQVLSTKNIVSTKANTWTYHVILGYTLLEANY